MGLNLTPAEGTSSSTGIGAGWTQLISVALDFGVSYLTAKSENKKNEELLKKMALLDKQQADELKRLINESTSEIAKTKVIFDFLNEQDAKNLEAQRKKEMIIPKIALGLGIIVLAIIFYKLHNQK